MLHYFTDIASYYFTDIMFTDIALCCVVVALAIGFACLLRVKLIAVNDQFAELIVCLGLHLSGIWGKGVSHDEL